MPIEKKRKLLNSYCSEVGCDKCKLKIGSDKWNISLDGLEECLDISNSPESDLDKALELIGVKIKSESKAKKTLIENDPVNHPSHYTDGKIEVIDFIEDKKLGFCLGNAVKYIARAGKKDPTKEIEDLKKAKWYVERRIKQLEEVKE